MLRNPGVEGILFWFVSLAPGLRSTQGEEIAISNFMGSKAKQEGRRCL
jgi:hypothetical protein